jgi:DNA polymerase III sliding clamp (beta) subunit (PCNA family)
MSILQDVLFSAWGGSLTVAASNSAQFASVVVNGLDKSMNGSFTIPGKQLVAWVSAIGDVDIAFNSDARSAKLKAGEAEIKFPTNIGAEFPVTPSYDGPQIINRKIIGVDFDTLKQMVKGTRFSVLDAESRPALHSLLFEIKENSLIMAGCDSFRVCEYKIPNPVAFPVPGYADVGELDSPGPDSAWADGTPQEVQTRFVVPTAVFTSLEHVNHKGYVDIAVGGGNIIFKVGVAEIGSKLIEEVYPDYTPIWLNYPIEFKFSKVDLMAALRRIGVLMEKEDYPVNIFLIPGKSADFSGRGDYGDVNESIPILFSSEKAKACTLMTNFKYLQEAISFCDDTVTFGFTAPNRALIILSEKVVGWRAAILPMFFPSKGQ